MVDRVLEGGVELVVVQFLDRFGRNPKEILQRYGELESHGVEVVATDEDIGDELVLLIKAGMAGAESRRTSERVRANMGRAVQKGVHAARAPYGLRRVYEGRKEVKWEIDPIEGPVVREMYRLSVDRLRRISDTRPSPTACRLQGTWPEKAVISLRIPFNEYFLTKRSWGP